MSRISMRTLSIPGALLSMLTLIACERRRDANGAHADAPALTAATPPNRTGGNPPAQQQSQLARLHDSLGPGPIWLSSGRPTERATTALAALSQATEHGLQTSAYDVARLVDLARTSGARALLNAEVEDFDQSLSMAMLRYLHDLRYGRLQPNPLSASDNRGATGDSTADALVGAIRGDSIAALAGALAPPLPEYRALQRLLARYRGLAAGAPPALRWSRLPARPGDTLAEGAALRRLLASLGDLSAGLAIDSSMFDSSLVQAVRRFQVRHGLDDDGVIGRATATALSVPLGERVTQIELALERLRWLPRVESSRHIFINIAAFRLLAFDSLASQAALDARVIIGDASKTRTPMLVRDLRFVDFWPYWNVPRSILVKEIVPILRRDGGYLRANDMEAVQGSDRVVGDSVSPELIRALVGGTLWIRQRPGPGNSLGRVRFTFPNDSNVFLHDTPARNLFARSRRDFSHGCIRVEHAGDLARWVLRERPGWADGDSVTAALAGPESRRLTLRQPIPVIVEYRTATVRPGGAVSFLPDIYGLDAALAKALADAGPRGGSAD